MATPASSATSPSPPIPFRSHPSHPLPPPAASTDPSEKEQRKKAVQKFLARAEISMVTRALRARLSYASYKAAHNIPHLSLRDLEERTLTQPQPVSLPRSIAAKRKVAAMNKESAASATIGPAMITSAHARGGSDSMAPPAAVSTTRNNAYPKTTGHTSAESGPTPRSGSSLYSSILAPPPIKQPRTIHHVNDPPIPAPPTPSSRTRVAKPSSGRGRGRAKAAERPLKPGESPGRRRKTSSIDKGKQKQALTDAEMNVDTDGDVAMKAAVTLTSWLLHSRQPTVAASPRSSFDGSEASSTYSHFAQSSARTTTATTASAASPAAASATSTAEPPAHSRTPSPASRAPEHATPRASTGDEEAADLMLLFAASPSPARPPGSKDKDARDMAAFRALSGGNNALLSKGRVLFPSSGDLPGPEDASPGPTSRQPQYRHQHTRSGPPLMRGADNSFSSSISSISSQLGRRGSVDAGRLGPPSQLLPPPPLPAARTTTPEHAIGRSGSTISSPKSSGGHTSDFNFSDFINASPSPARPGAGQILSLGQGLAPSAQKPNLGLRADVGRKLFEEEQIRNGTGASVPKSPRARGLGAGIDLDAMRS
ncbi:hypothetical protein APHAL10511_007694 [Amanita phalloides]|nr:hypothetical protein APHAL10511_007694 [Amanita phalloides]